MRFYSTRNKNVCVSGAEAVCRGISEEGGLFVPSAFPQITETQLRALCDEEYESLAAFVIGAFLPELREQLPDYCRKAYAKFESDPPAVAPLVKLDDNLCVLELWHGPTCAFKDVALTLLPYLLDGAKRATGNTRTTLIPVATSGDTGKAALEGFAGVEGTRIMVFFPEDGVSPVQKLQMTTQEGENTCVVGIKGNFDDAQSAVKSIFTDKALAAELDAKGYCFSSANSINIGRLVPQIVYYFWAYLRAAEMGEIKLGEELNFTVPTGNFGDILAGWYAMKMGLPVGHFVCASNDNKVLYDFFRTGTYDRNRAFHVTISPSMDILISSNLERLLCHMGGQEKTGAEMESLAKNGTYTAEITEKRMSGEFATERETAEAIRAFYEGTGYVMDTHTAVAYAAYKKYQAESGDMRPMVIVSTASPYKFTKDVMTALDAKYAEGDAFALMSELEKAAGVAVPQPIRGLEQREIRHRNVCEKGEIKDVVKNWLK